LIELLSGNEAIARGAWEAGVTVAAGYPGTPSTEILENVVKYKDDIYCEWAPNEKVAFEVVAGAVLAGARGIVTMKHVGLNVAADPLMTLANIGVNGGMVICVADDPGMHSSQNEQDTRNYARFAKIPIFEPADSNEAKNLVLMAMDISEKFKTPVILRSTTRVSHSRSLVELADRRKPNDVAFEKEPSKYVPVPLWARPMRVKVEKRLEMLARAANQSPANRIESRSKDLGIIACGIAYQYVREVWPDASVLKLAWTYPWPDQKFKEFAAAVEKVLVVEELDSLVEEHLKSIGIDCVGREFVSGIGELSVTTLRDSKAKMSGQQPRKYPYKSIASELPARPPVLCAGCPHRGIFHALTKHDVVVTGDIGCYSLGTFKPLDRLDTILCMGGGVSMAHGFDKAGEKKPIVGMVGDSTFFHSGITGLLDIGYNKGKVTIFVLDNRTTAMTGHQEHPGTGLTLMREETMAASIAKFGQACGIKRIKHVDPYDVKTTQQIISEEIDADQASLIISEAPCLLRVRKAVGPQRKIDPDICKNCKACLKLGCPAIEPGMEKPVISEFLCAGCALCEQICPFDAISAVEDNQ